MAAVAAALDLLDLPTAINATAWTAIDSPAPIESTPSLVFPLTLTCDASLPSAPATLRAIASTCGASFGRCAMTTTSTLTIAKPASRDDR